MIVNIFHHFAFTMAKSCCSLHKSHYFSSKWERLACFFVWVPPTTIKFVYLNCFRSHGEWQSHVMFSHLTTNFVSFRFLLIVLVVKNNNIPSLWANSKNCELRSDVAVVRQGLALIWFRLISFWYCRFSFSLALSLSLSFSPHEFENESIYLIKFIRKVLGKLSIFKIQCHRISHASTKATVYLEKKIISFFSLINNLLESIQSDPLFSNHSKGNRNKNTHKEYR